MYAWILAALILNPANGEIVDAAINPKVFKNERECRAELATVLESVPAGKPIAVGCMAIKLKEA